MGESQKTLCSPKLIFPYWGRMSFRFILNYKHSALGKAIETMG